MKEVILITTQTCPFCPLAKKFWEELKKEIDFKLEVIDAFSQRGQELVKKFDIRAVPTTIIDGEVKFVGIPKKEEALEALKE